MIVPAALLQDVVEHAREEFDAECCGLIAYGPDRDGRRRAMRVHRARNIHASRKRFEIDGREILAAERDFEHAGWEIGAIYHSHTHTEPYPSQTDINFAANWPGLEWVIVGLAAEQPHVRCFAVERGQVREVALEVV